MRIPYFKTLAFISVIGFGAVHYRPAINPIPSIIAASQPKSVPTQAMLAAQYDREADDLEEQLTSHDTSGKWDLKRRTDEIKAYRDKAAALR